MLFGISTALITALALTLVPIKPATAQSGGRVQVALVDSLSSPSARAEVVRFAGERPDIILLRSSTVTKDDVTAALVAWEKARVDRPARPGLTARMTIVGGGRADGADSRIVRRAEAILRQLKAAPAVRVGNLGRGRWGEFDAR
jgi:hypothetical protein